MKSKAIVKVVSDAAAIVGGPDNLGAMMGKHRSTIYRWEDPLHTSEPSASEYLFMVEIIRSHQMSNVLNQSAMR